MPLAAQARHSASAPFLSLKGLACAPPGNNELCKRVREVHGRKLVVVGGKKDRVPGCTLMVNDGDRHTPSRPRLLRSLLFSTQTMAHFPCVALPFPARLVGAIPER